MNNADIIRFRVLVGTTRDCRQCQKQYFATRDHDDLVMAKATEARLDGLLRSFDMVGNPLPQLFDKTAVD